MDLIKNKKFHFVAIGGVGMSALAVYLANHGAVVSGTDIQQSKYTLILENAGIKVNIGHNENLVEKDMTIVASSAVKNTNPEIIKAKELGLKIYHRSDILKLISDEFSKRQGSYFIGFSGTHGKTTTSGLCSYVLSKSGYSPSYVVGGIIPELGNNGIFDGEKYFCAELDESDGTIQKYSTDIAVINNLEEDHLDYYKNGFKDIAETFNKFLSNNPAQKVVINTDNSGNNSFINLYPDYNYITFGIENTAMYYAKNIIINGLTSQFDIYQNNTKLAQIKLSIPGKHNIYNALAVFAALKEANVNMDSVYKHFETFSGMGRRFQKVCEFNGIKVYDDYAHHPSEIKTTLISLKNSLNQQERAVAVFQPHRYTRLKGLWEEFKKAFEYTDKLFITDIYSAGEDKIEGITSENFSKDLKNTDNTYISGTIEECAKKIYPLLKKNDIVITLGAGTITKLGKLLEKESEKVH